MAMAECYSNVKCIDLSLVDGDKCSESESIAMTDDVESGIETQKGSFEDDSDKEDFMEIRNNKTMPCNDDFKCKSYYNSDKIFNVAMSSIWKRRQVQYKKLMEMVANLKVQSLEERRKLEDDDVNLFMLKRQNEELACRIDFCNRQTRKLCEIQSELLAENSKNHEKADVLLFKISRLQPEIEEQKLTIRSVELKLGNMKKQNVAGQIVLRKLKDQRDELKNAITDLQNKKNELHPEFTKRIDEKQEQFRKLFRIEELLKEELDNYKRQMNPARELSNLRLELEDMKKKLKQASVQKLPVKSSDSKTKWSLDYWVFPIVILPQVIIYVMKNRGLIN